MSRKQRNAAVAVAHGSISGETVSRTLPVWTHNNERRNDHGRHSLAMTDRPRRAVEHRTARTTGGAGRVT